MSKKPFEISAALFSIALLISSSTQSSASTVLKISESGNSKTFSIKSGSTVEITLHSTFWSQKLITNLRAIDAPTMTAIMPGPTAPANCQLPGMGCGTIVWKFTAIKKGKASFVATRTSCGEALRCTGKDGRFTFSLKVT
jgi:hypothetical protein